MVKAVHGIAKRRKRVIGGGWGSDLGLLLPKELHPFRTSPRMTGTNGAAVCSRTRRSGCESMRAYLDGLEIPSQTGRLDFFTAEHSIVGLSRESGGGPGIRFRVVESQYRRQKNIEPPIGAINQGRKTEVEMRGNDLFCLCCPKRSDSGLFMVSASPRRDSASFSKIAACRDSSSPQIDRFRSPPEPPIADTARTHANGAVNNRNPATEKTGAFIE